MAAYERIVNDAETILDAAIGSGDSSLSVADAAGFPTDGVFRIRIDNEIIRVDSVSGTTFNVTRGQEGTATADHVRGSQVAAIVTEHGFTRILTERGYPMVQERPPYRIADSSDNILTSSDFIEDDVAGTMTITDHDDGPITLYHEAFATSEKVAGIYRNAPTPPYDVIGAYRAICITSGPTEGPIIGPAFRRSANDNKLVWRHRPFDDLITFKHNVNHYAGSVFQANVGTWRRFDHPPGAIKWFWLRDNNTNLQMYSSSDGIHWAQVYGQTRTLYLGGAPDQVGLAIDNLSGFDMYLNLLAWKEM